MLQYHLCGVKYMEKVLAKDFHNEEIKEYMIVKPINNSASLTLFVILTDLQGRGYAVSINEFDRKQVRPINDMHHFQIVKGNDNKPLYLNDELATKLEEDFRIKMESGMYNKYVYSNVADLLSRVARKLGGLNYDDKFYEELGKTLDIRELRYLSDILSEGCANCDNTECERRKGSCTNWTNYKVIGEYKYNNRKAW